MLPPEDPKRESVAWCIERPDQGRGMAVVMPHFYRNWSNEDLRRFVLNGVIWTARLEVPASGANSSLPDLSTFQPAAIEPLPPKPKTKEPTKSAPRNPQSKTEAETKAEPKVDRQADPNKTGTNRIDLSHWKLTLPVAAKRKGAPQPLELSADELKHSEEHNEYFDIRSDGSLVFWCPVNGVPTKNTKYPRTELREVIDPTDDNVCWPATGQHILRATCRVLEVPSSGKVIIGQIHGYSGKALPLIKLQMHKDRIEALVKTSIEKDTETKLSFPLEERQPDIAFEIRIDAGKLSVRVNSVTQAFDLFEREPAWADQSLYFKAGAYVQDNEGPSTEGARIVFTQLTVQHNQ